MVRSINAPLGMARFVVIAAMLVLVGNSHATTVLRLPFEEVCDQAELIFEGRVVDVSPRMDEEGRYIWTHVEIEVLEAIKGRHDANQIELKFAGGSLNGLTLDVGEMHVPQVGEHGIYFVDSLSRQLVHPLVGWDQGHYRVERTPDGVRRMMTANGSFIQSILPQQIAGQEFSTGIPYGVAVIEADARLHAMPIADFKSTVRQLAR